jgi:NAD(P)H dehydrogenase (quinone)
MNKAKIVIAYHSGYGHTAKQAEAVFEGVASAGMVGVEMIKVAEIDDRGWASLAEADGIIFGAPTYMGGASAPFKTFADATSKAWFELKWKDKIAGGFTNSASMNGDKHSTIAYFMTLAMQHGMIWVGTGLLPANKGESKRNDINYLGGSSGALAQSPSDLGPDQGPAPGDLETAKLYGKRVAEIVKKFKGE